MKTLKITKAQKEALESTAAQLVVTIGLSVVSLVALAAVKAVTEANVVIETAQTNN